MLFLQDRGIVNMFKLHIRLQLLLRSKNTLLCPLERILPTTLPSISLY